MLFSNINTRRKIIKNHKINKKIIKKGEKYKKEISTIWIFGSLEGSVFLSINV